MVPLEENIQDCFVCKTENKKNCLNNIILHNFGFYVSMADKGKKSKEEKCGYASVSLNQYEKIAKWEMFFPLKSLPNAIGKGLGALAHLLVLLELQREYEDINSYKMIHDFGTTSNRRCLQLSKMGIIGDSEIVTEFGEYFDKSMSYAEKIGLNLNIITRQQ